MIAAILRAQLLSMSMGGRGRVFSVLTGLFWYGVWVIVACAVYLGISASAGRLQIFLPLGALAVCLYWQAMPILSASMGSALDMRKLMVYPVPHARLFQVEVLLRLTTGIEMLMVLAGSVAGMFHRSAAMGWLALPAVLIYVVFNLLLASGTRSLLERLLSKRKVRELLVFVVFTLWMLPRFLYATGHRPRLTGNWIHLIETVAGRGPPPPGPPWDVPSCPRCFPSPLGPCSPPGSAAPSSNATCASIPLRRKPPRRPTASPHGKRSPKPSTAFPRAAFATPWPPSSKRNCAPWPARRATAWSSSWDFRSASWSGCP